MSEKSRGVSIRLSLRDHEVVKKALQDLGRDGEVALRKLERATAEPTRGLMALNSATGQARDGIRDLAARSGPAGSALSALGPIGLAAAAGVGALTVAFVGFMRTAREVAQLKDLSEKIGVDVEALQELRFAAEQTGIEVATLDTSLETFGRRAADAAKGTGEARGAFAELGVSVLGAGGALKPVEVMIRDVAEAMQSVPKAADRMRLAYAMFGRAGTDMVRVLNEGRAGIDGFATQARSMGMVFDRDMIEKADEAEKKISLLSASLDARLKRVLLGLAPVASGVLSILESIGGAVDTLARSGPVRGIEGVKSLTDALTLLRDVQEELAQRQMGGGQIAFSGPTRQLQQMERDLVALTEAYRINESEGRRFAARLSTPLPSDGFTPTIRAAEELSRRLAELEARYQAATSGSLAQVAALEREEKARKLAEQTARAHAAEMGQANLAQEDLAALVAQYLPQAQRQVALEAQITQALERRRQATEAATAAAVAEETAREDASKRARALIKERDDLVRATTREVGESKALTEALKQGDREYRIVQRSQALLRQDTLLTAQAARKLATELVDADREMERVRNAGDFVSKSLTRGFDRVGEAITQALATGKRDLLDMGNIGRAVLSELVQGALQLAAINPLKNAVTGSQLPTLGSVVGSGQGGGGVLSTISNAKSVWDLGQSLTGGNWLASALPSVFGATAVGTMAGGATAASLGVSAVAGGASNVGVAAAAPLASIAPALSVVLPIAAIAAPLILSALMKKKPSDFTASFQGTLGNFIDTEDKANPETRQTRDQLRDVFEGVLDEVRRNLGARTPEDLYIDAAVGSRDGYRSWGFGLNPDGSVNRNNKLFEGKYENADQLTAATLQEILRRSEGLSENARKVVDTLDFAEAGLARSSELLGFAENFDLMLKTLTQGALSTGDAIEGTVKAQMDAARDSLDKFRSDAKEGGQDLTAAESAIRSYVQILVGAADPSVEALSTVEGEMRRIAAVAQYAAPLLEQAGLGLEALTQGVQRQTEQLREGFLTGISDRLLAISNPAALAIRQLDTEFARLRRDADLLNLSLAERAKIEELYGLTLRQITAEQQGAGLRAVQTYMTELERGTATWIRLAEQLRAGRQSLLLDPALSPLDVRGRYDEARAQFDEVSRRALLGDQDAIAEFPEIRRAFLEASKAFNASNAEFARDFSESNDISLKIEALTKRHVDTAQAQLDELRRQAGQIDQLIGGTSLLITSFDQAVALLAEISGKLTAVGNGGGGWVTPGITPNAGGGIDINAPDLPSSDGQVAGPGGTPAWQEYLATASPAQLAAAGLTGSVTSRDQFVSQLSGLSSAQLIAAGLTGKAFAYGGDHTGGLRLVGERGPELEVTGPSRIFPPEKLVQMMGAAMRAPGASPAGDAAAQRELQGLRRDVAMLGREVVALRQALVQVTAQSGLMVRDAVLDGNRMTADMASAARREAVRPQRLREAG